MAERTDLSWLVSQMPKLQAIACNGKLAFRLATGIVTGLEQLSLPSSSPANTMPLAAKQAQWMVLAGYLADGGRTKKKARRGEP